MQKWEYMTAQVVLGDKKNTVMEIGNEHIGHLKFSLSSMTSTKGGEELDEFLNRVGSEGWEVISSQTTGQVNNWLFIILRRPLE